MKQLNALALRSLINRRRCFGNIAGVLIALLALGTTVSPGEGAERLSRADKAKLAREVKAIFQNKCVKCHGPEGVRETEKAKGELDYILDLARLSSSPKLIAPGDPDNSKLYNMVADFLMPDDTAGEEPLPDNEIRLIGSWIKAGAPTEKGIAAAMKFRCPAIKKIDLKMLYGADQLKKRQFSTRLEELPDGVFLDQCSFSASAGKVACNRKKVDRVEFDARLQTRKFYIFEPQINFQLFANLTSITDDGVGGVEYGKCEYVAP